MMPLARVASALKSFAKFYVKSWLLLLWSAACTCLGAAWMYLAIVAALKANGVSL